jgi:pimeloyl-ACP methyl ester carboxylesterase
MTIGERARDQMIPLGIIFGTVRIVSPGVVTAPVPLSLHTFRWGRSGNPPALLVHGVQASANSWWRIADALAHGGLHVTAPDLRGHGQSPPGRRYGLADFAADLLELGTGWDLVVGHSLGGTLVAHLLADEPDFARRAVLLDPVLRLPEEDFDTIVAGQLAELAAADVAALQVAHPAWHPEDCRIKAQAAAACSPFVNEAVLRENRPWDYSELLARTQIPMLVLGADPAAGGMLDPVLAESLAASNALVRYHKLSGVGHSVHRDQPQIVIDVLLDGV